MRQKIFDILDSLKIPYTNYEHLRVFTCDEAKGVDIPGERVKSLLIRNKKAINFYMVVLKDSTRLDTNIVRAHFDDSKMSFASEEEMMQKILLKPGSVSPFALINNSVNDVIVVFEKALQNKVIGLHPLQNDNTTVLDINDLLIFLDNIGSQYNFVEF